MTQTTATQRGAVPEPSQFNIDRTHPGRWTITFNNPPINIFVPSAIGELGTLLTELEADPSVKVVVFVKPVRSRLIRVFVHMLGLLQNYLRQMLDSAHL